VRLIGLAVGGASLFRDVPALPTHNLDETVRGSLAYSERSHATSGAGHTLEKPDPMKTQNMLVAAAVASLFAGAALAGDKAPAKAGKDTAQVKCTGVNECKGKGACGGAGHDCAGNNECKGKGWVSLAEKDCKAKGGTVVADAKK
jgi:hypothetical protein